MVTPYTVILGKDKTNKQPQMNDNYGLASYMLMHSCRNLIINELIIRITSKSKYSIEYR